MSRMFIIVAGLIAIVVILGILHGPASRSDLQQHEIQQQAYVTTTTGPPESSQQMTLIEWLARVTENPEDVKAYQARAAGLKPDDLQGWLALAGWAQDRGLAVRAMKALGQVSLIRQAEALAESDASRFSQGMAGGKTSRPSKLEVGRILARMADELFAEPSPAQQFTSDAGAILAGMKARPGSEASSSRGASRYGSATTAEANEPPSRSESSAGVPVDRHSCDLDRRNGGAEPTCIRSVQPSVVNCPSGWSGPACGGEPTLCPDGWKGPACGH